MAHALSIVCDAVQRYKDLCEGKYAGEWGGWGGALAGVRGMPPRIILSACGAELTSASLTLPADGLIPSPRPQSCAAAPAAAGQSVGRIQHVEGVDFSYQPPPRTAVPYAASLKGQSSK